MTPDAPRPLWQRQLPNAITALRVLLAAAFVAVLSIYSASAPSWRSAPALLIAALALFLVAALSDFLDGHLARRWRVVSIFGRVVDPFADKILVLGAFVMLAGPSFADLRDGRIIQTSGVLPWMVVVILARDLLVTTLRALVESRGQSFAAIAAGKIKMIVQSAGVPLILLITLAYEPSPIHLAPALTLANLRDMAPSFAQDVALLVTLVTAWSAIPYTTRGVRILRATPERAP